MFRLICFKSWELFFRLVAYYPPEKKMQFPRQGKEEFHNPP